MEIVEGQIVFITKENKNEENTPTDGIVRRIDEDYVILETNNSLYKTHINNISEDEEDSWLYKQAQIDEKAVNKLVGESYINRTSLNSLKHPKAKGNTYGDHFDAHGDNAWKVASAIRKERDEVEKKHGYKSAMFHDRALKAYRSWKKTRKATNESLNEEAPANAAGGGNIAAIGQGPDGEPGVFARAIKKYKKKNKKESPRKIARKMTTVMMGEAALNEDKYPH